jgi:hypothetical protein
MVQGDQPYGSSAYSLANLIFAISAVPLHDQRTSHRLASWRFH